MSWAAVAPNHRSLVPRNSTISDTPGWEKTSRAMRSSPAGPPPTAESVCTTDVRALAVMASFTTARCSEAGSMSMRCWRTFTQLVVELNPSVIESPSTAMLPSPPVCSTSIASTHRSHWLGMDSPEPVGEVARSPAPLGATYDWMAEQQGCTVTRPRELTYTLTAKVSSSLTASATGSLVTVWPTGTVTPAWPEN